MASITLTFSNADATRIGAAYRVSTVPEFKAKLLDEIKRNTKLYEEEQRRLTAEPIVEPDIT